MGWEMRLEGMGLEMGSEIRWKMGWEVKLDWME